MYWKAAKKLKFATVEKNMWMSASLFDDEEEKKGNEG
jgi:hypothetical protein